MGLVNAKEIAKAIHVDSYGAMGTFLGWSLLKVTNISTLNKIYDKLSHLEGLEFINALLDEFGVNYDIPEEDLKRIPKTGPFITISNHPLETFTAFIFQPESISNWRKLVMYMFLKVLPS